MANERQGPKQEPGEGGGRAAGFLVEIGSVIPDLVARAASNVDMSGLVRAEAGA